MFNMHPYETCPPVFIIRNKVLNTYCVYKFSCAMFVKLYLNYFIAHIPSHKYSTRSRDEFSSLAHSTTHYERSPAYNCITTYNRSASSHFQFKKKLKSYLILKCFYSFNKFLICQYIVCIIYYFWTCTISLLI